MTIAALVPIRVGRAISVILLCGMGVGCQTAARLPAEMEANLAGSGYVRDEKPSKPTAFRDGPLLQEGSFFCRPPQCSDTNLIARSIYRYDSSQRADEVVELIKSEPTPLQAFMDSMPSAAAGIDDKVLSFRKVRTKDRVGLRASVRLTFSDKRPLYGIIEGTIRGDILTVDYSSSSNSDLTERGLATLKRYPAP